MFAAIAKDGIRKTADTIRSHDELRSLAHADSQSRRALRNPNSYIIAEHCRFPHRSMKFRGEFAWILQQPWILDVRDADKVCTCARLRRASCARTSGRGQARPLSASERFFSMASASISALRAWTLARTASRGAFFSARTFSCADFGGVGVRVDFLGCRQCGRGGLEHDAGVCQGLVDGGSLLFGSGRCLSGRSDAERGGLGERSGAGRGLGCRVLGGGA